MFTPVTCQVALFFSPDFQIKPLSIAGKIAEKLSSIFSVEPSTIPYPPGMPISPEFPRVILQGDKSGQVTVSQLRADIVFNLKEIDDAETKLSEHILAFAECFESDPIVRLGLVIVFNLVGESSLSIIKNKYIHPEQLDGAKELYVGWLNKIELGGVPANKIVNFNCNNYSLPQGSGTLMVDINTFQESILELKTNDVRNFINDCIRQYRGDVNEFIE